MTAHSCTSCGSTLPADAPGGLCPRCLLAGGLHSSDPGRTSDYVPFEAPAVAEIASLFPQLEIMELLGAGGMGAVYKARQPQLDRIVALKVLPRRDDPAFAERFTREARALAKLNHPGIVTVHDFGQAGGLYYFVMEFVDGVNLRQAERTGKLTPAEALAIVPQICTALQFAHDAGVVHRDIKPENILLDAKGRVKIADFGLAKLSDKEGPTPLTQTHQVMGTMHYMAPEQWEKPSTVDHRADIYSLGVVFYELLTGELPLGRFPLPSEKVQIDVRLDDIVLRTLEKQPERRYQHASDVKTDVEKVAITIDERPIPPVDGIAEEMKQLNERKKKLIDAYATDAAEKMGRDVSKWWHGLTSVQIAFLLAAVVIIGVAGVSVFALRLVAVFQEENLKTVGVKLPLFVVMTLSMTATLFECALPLVRRLRGAADNSAGPSFWSEVYFPLWPVGVVWGLVSVFPLPTDSRIILNTMGLVGVAIALLVSLGRWYIRVAAKDLGDRSASLAKKNLELLLDETDTVRRSAQHVGILAGGLLGPVGVLLLLAGLGGASSLYAWLGGVCLAAFVAFWIVAAGQKQRWEIDYKGHCILFENSVFTAERLLIDGVRAARGGFGTRMELTGLITFGEGAGDRIIAWTAAGLGHFRLRLYAEANSGTATPATPLGTAAKTLTDARLSPPSFFRHVALPLITFLGILWLAILAFDRAHHPDPTTSTLSPLGLIPVAVVALPPLIWRWLAKRRGKSMLSLVWNPAGAEYSPGPLLGAIALIVGLVSVFLPWAEVRFEGKLFITLMGYDGWYGRFIGLICAGAIAALIGQRAYGSRRWQAITLTIAGLFVLTLATISLVVIARGMTISETSGDEALRPVAMNVFGHMTALPREGAYLSVLVGAAVLILGLVELRNVESYSPFRRSAANQTASPPSIFLRVALPALVLLAIWLAAYWFVRSDVHRVNREFQAARVVNPNAAIPEDSPFKDIAIAVMQAGSVVGPLITLVLLLRWMWLALNRRRFWIVSAAMGLGLPVIGGGLLYVAAMRTGSTQRQDAEGDVDSARNRIVGLWQRLNGIPNTVRFRADGTFEEHSRVKAEEAADPKKPWTTNSGQYYWIGDDRIEVKVPGNPSRQLRVIVHGDDLTILEGDGGFRRFMRLAPGLGAGLDWERFLSNESLLIGKWDWLGGKSGQTWFRADGTFEEAEGIGVRVGVHPPTTVGQYRWIDQDTIELKVVDLPLRRSKVVISEVDDGPYEMTILEKDGSVRRMRQVTEPRPSPAGKSP